jgi:hypothetical protein
MEDVGGGDKVWLARNAHVQLMVILMTRQSKYVTELSVATTTTLAESTAKACGRVGARHKVHVTRCTSQGARHKVHVTRYTSQ